MCIWCWEMGKTCLNKWRWLNGNSVKSVIWTSGRANIFNLNVFYPLYSATWSTNSTCNTTLLMGVKPKVKWGYSKNDVAHLKFSCQGGQNTFHLFFFDSQDSWTNSTFQNCLTTIITFYTITLNWSPYIYIGREIYFLLSSWVQLITKSSLEFF